MSHEPEPCWVVTADLHVQMDPWVRRAAGHGGFLDTSKQTGGPMRSSNGYVWRRGELLSGSDPEHQRQQALVGASIRSWLTEHGSPTWEPADDHSWREWIELQGDTCARRFLKGLDELVRREALERLGQDPEWKRQQAIVGAEVRSRLAEHGSQTWDPADDHSWREWVEFQGDTYARRLLKELDELVHRKFPGMVERGE